MEKTTILAFTLFVVFTFLVWKFTKEHFKKEYGLKQWKNWGNQVYFWQSAFFLSMGCTLLTMYVLKWSNILTF